MVIAGWYWPQKSNKSSLERLFWSPKSAFSCLRHLQERHTVFNPASDPAEQKLKSGTGSHTYACHHSEMTQANHVQTQLALDHCILNRPIWNSVKEAFQPNCKFNHLKDPLTCPVPFYALMFLQFMAHSHNCSHLLNLYILTFWYCVNLLGPFLPSKFSSHLRNESWIKEN